MRTLLNILWFIFGGWISGSLWLLSGVIMSISIIGLPFAPAAFRMGFYSYFPFGLRVEEHDVGATSTALNIVWLVLAGWWLALHHLALAIGLALTIIGIPFAIQHLKLAVYSLMPVGKTIVQTDSLF
jgi:uncharacterized membrane protein YccF (DUF307 family)